MIHRHHKPRRRIGVPKGMLRHISLNILKQEPMSGSELMEQIYDYTDWRPSPGSMYPLLAILQEENLIMPYESDEPSMKRFTLTEEGERLVDEQRTHDQEMRSRHKSMRKIYWRLHRRMPLGLYTSFSNFLEMFEGVFNRVVEDEQAQTKLIQTLDDVTKRLTEIAA
ncbi:PadR family transcriptional regulator [Candidatus Bathyarchaeota archaeon]|nr:PadR family transcriptional regulator [Candidatus Bathyarchaeota archaeon]